MAESIAHRGPDDDGQWIQRDEGVALAHRRLSIIDLSANGRQPMVSPSGRFVMVYNGEVYNFRELRGQIEQKASYPWRSSSDTEVMLAAFDVWGVEEAVRLFVGMFAFALWDREERALYLCRDRMGIKPLYYGLYGTTFLFGSELKALRIHPDFEPQIDRNAIALYLRHNCIPSPYCIYKNTFKLEPGKILKINADQIGNDQTLPSPKTYWSIESVIEQSSRISSQSPFDEEEVTSRLEHLLKDAIAMRMVSDVPLGVFLSGGIDSTTVTALMQAQSHCPVKTFSIGFDEDDYNEAEHAKAVAGHLGTDHTELTVTSDEALATVPELPKLYDEPFGDSSQIPTFLLSKLTRRYVTVSLSGDGGDELFGGYNRYHWTKKIRSIQNVLPRALVVRSAEKASQIRPATWDNLFKRLAFLVPQKYRFGAAGDKVHKLLQALQFYSSKEIYCHLVSHWQEPERIVIHSKEPPTKITTPDEYPPLENQVQLMMYLDSVTYLPDDILTKLDRASMGVGLEARVPFLDHRVAEMAWQIPQDMKIRNGIGKWILRQILYQYVPKELIERPKAGFAIPLDSWLRGPLRDWAESLLNRKKLVGEGFFRTNSIRKKWKEHLSGERNWQYQLWDILMFQAWLENEKN